MGLRKIRPGKPKGNSIKDMGTAPSGFSHKHCQVSSTSHGLCALQPCPAPEQSIADTREANPAKWGDGQTAAWVCNTSPRYAYYHELMLPNPRSTTARPTAQTSGHSE